MAEFLVTITLDLEAVPAGERDELLARERATALKLGEQGAIVRMWRVRGGRSTVSVWRAEHTDELTALLTRLPLRQWMDIEVEPLEPHYADPAYRRDDAGGG